jgi:esterase/lipase
MKDIILLHGAIGASDQLNPLAESLSAKGFSVHQFSFSGHGKIPFAQQFSIEQFATELYQFILEHNLEQVNVFGYSMGGYVALYLGSQKPNLMGKIATLATKFDWNPEGAVKEAAMLNPETIQQKVPTFAEALQNRHGENWIALLNKTAEMMQVLGDAPLLTDEVLNTIESPVLLGLGDKDSMVSLDETRKVFAALTKSNMYMLPNTKHPIEGVNVELLSAVLEGYLK